MDEYKIVDYTKCNTCKHFKESEATDICNDCLNNPANIDSHTPIRWERRTDYETK